MPLVAELLRSGERAVRQAAVVAVAQLGERALADTVALSLDAASADERMQAAVTSGVLGATKFATRLAERLDVETGLAFAGLVGAIELLGDTSVVPQLLTSLRQAPENHIWDLTHALRILTGVDPVTQETGTRRNFLGELRTTWLAAAVAGLMAAPPPPSIEGARMLGPELATFALRLQSRASAPCETKRSQPQPPRSISI